MTGVGGVSPGLTIVAVVPETPAVSVTFRPTVTFCEAEYVNAGVGDVESPYTPSPLRSHEYVSALPELEIDFVPSKCTVRGSGPNFLSALMTAMGGEL